MADSVNIFNPFWTFFLFLTAAAHLYLYSVGAFAHHTPTLLRHDVVMMMAAMKCDTHDTDASTAYFFLPPSPPHRAAMTMRRTGGVVESQMQEGSSNKHSSSLVASSYSLQLLNCCKSPLPSGSPSPMFSPNSNHASGLMPSRGLEFHPGPGGHPLLRQRRSHRPYPACHLQACHLRACHLPSFLPSFAAASS